MLNVMNWNQLYFVNFRNVKNTFVKHNQSLKLWKNKLGLSWAKLSQSWYCVFIALCLSMVKISLDKYPNVFLKLSF